MLNDENRSTLNPKVISISLLYKCEPDQWEFNYRVKKFSVVVRLYVSNCCEREREKSEVNINEIGQ